MGDGFACLTWLYGLFVRTLILLTNVYASCGRSTLNFIEPSVWLGSVRSVSKLNAKCTQMNYKMNCITMHKCTELYSNVLPKGPSTLASASLVSGKTESELLRLNSKLKTQTVPLECTHRQLSFERSRL